MISAPELSAELRDRVNRWIHRPAEQTLRFAELSKKFARICRFPYKLKLLPYTTECGDNTAKINPVSTGNAIVVKYWVSTDHLPFDDLKGIQEFRDELASAYVSVVSGRAAGAGGITHLLVELTSTLSMSHLAQLILDGVAFDLIKNGAEAFVLRPFIAAYKRLQERNKDDFVDIGELKIQFRDSLLVLHEVSNNTLVSELENILTALARSYDKFLLKDGQAPYTIEIPVFEDPEEDRPCRFRVIGDIDETIRSRGPQDYLGFWGLEYDHAGLRVFDVQRQLLLDEQFNTLDRHWAEMIRRAETEFARKHRTREG